MFSIERVLIPVDFRHPEERVLEYAHELMVGPNGKILVLHIEEPADAGVAAPPAGRLMDGLLESAACKGMNCEGRILQGPIAATILEQAQIECVDCIIMAPRGLAAVNRTVAVSTHDSLLKTSSIPVLAVTPRSDILMDANAVVSKPDTILCPVDETEFSQCAISLATDLALLYQSRLLVVNACFDPDTDEHTSKAIRKLVEERLDGGASIHLDVALTPPGQLTSALLDTIEGEHAGLVVLSTHGRSRFAQVFRPSVAESLTTFATCPVLALRPDLMPQFRSETVAQA